MSVEVTLYIGPLIKIPEDSFDISRFYDLGIHNQIFNSNDPVNGFFYLGPNQDRQAARRFWGYLISSEDDVIELDKIDQEADIRWFITKFAAELKILEENFGKLEVTWGIRS